MNRTSIDVKWMRLALTLARKARGRTRPNPAVGAVIVKNGRLLSAGYHRRAGEPHAEIEALRKVGHRQIRGADCYVTLEPCNHTGRTPPCSEALIEAGVRRVVVAMRDPNPSVRGGGLERLAEAGIEVDSGLLESEARKLNESWIKRVTTGLPFIILKIASSFDGKVATATGESRWISSEQSRYHAHRIRSTVDAILIGRGTLMSDNPSLTARIGDRIIAAPLRIVADSSLQSPPTAQMFRPEHPGRSIIAVRDRAGEERRHSFDGLNVEIFDAGDDCGKTDIKVLLEELGRRGIERVLVEGGPELNHTLLRRRLVDTVMLYLAPMLIGGRDARSAIEGEGLGRLDQVPRLLHVRVRRLGPDLLVTGNPDYTVESPEKDG